MAYKKKLTRHRWSYLKFYVTSPYMAEVKEKCKECGLIRVRTKIYKGDPSIHYELNKQIIVKIPQCSEVINGQIQMTKQTAIKG